MPNVLHHENFEEEETPTMWALFHVYLTPHEFVYTLIGVSKSQQKLIEYADAMTNFTLNSQFDESKGRYRIEDKSDYYGKKTEFLKDFPLFIKRVHEIT